MGLCKRCTAEFAGISGAEFATDLGEVRVLEFAVKEVPDCSDRNQFDCAEFRLRPLCGLNVGVAVPAVRELSPTQVRPIPASAVGLFVGFRPFSRLPAGEYLFSNHVVFGGRGYWPHLSAKGPMNADPLIRNAVAGNLRVQLFVKALECLRERVSQRLHPANVGFHSSCLE